MKNAEAYKPITVFQRSVRRVLNEKGSTANMLK